MMNLELKKDRENQNPKAQEKFNSRFNKDHQFPAKMGEW